MCTSEEINGAWSPLARAMMDRFILLRDGGAMNTLDQSRDFRTLCGLSTKGAILDLPVPRVPTAFTLGRYFMLRRGTSGPCKNCHRVSVGGN